MSTLIIMKVVIIVMLVFSPWREGEAPHLKGTRSPVYSSQATVLAQVVSLPTPGSHRTCRLHLLPELFINVTNWLYTSGISAAHL